MALTPLPKGMTPTETKAYHWLISQGYRVLKFDRSKSPDFTTDKGYFEIKRPVGHNTIVFTYGQIDRIKAVNAEVLIFTDKTNAPIKTIDSKALDSANPAIDGFTVKVIQLGQLNITITEEGTKDLLERYCEFLGIKPATVIALAMRNKLPDLPRGIVGT